MCEHGILGGMANDDKSGGSDSQLKPIPFKGSSRLAKCGGP